MNKFVIFFLSALVVAVAATDLEDVMNVNLEELLADEARRKEIFDCIMDQGPCGEYQIYRDLLPTLAVTKCEKCTPKQKKKYEEVNKYLLENYPAEYNAFVLKYLKNSE